MSKERASDPWFRESTVDDLILDEIEILTARGTIHVSPVHVKGVFVGINVRTVRSADARSYSGQMTVRPQSGNSINVLLSNRDDT